MTNKIKVLFVKSTPEWGNEITAVFPYELGDSQPITMSCYAHTGQHSSCHADWVKEQEKATPEEYKELYDELIRVGYEMSVLTYFPDLPSYAYRAKMLRKNGKTK